MLARCFPPLLWSALRLHAGAARLWSRPQDLTPAQFLAVSRYILPSELKPFVGGSMPLHGMIWCLVLIGFLYGVLALNLPNVESQGAGEAASRIRVMALGPRAFCVTSRAEARPLTPAALPASVPHERFTLGDCDVVDDDSSAMSRLSLNAHFLPPLPVCIGLNGSARICMWLAHYLLRPQLLSRL
jgi:hypothetical protein